MQATQSTMLRFAHIRNGLEGAYLINQRQTITRLYSTYRQTFTRVSLHRVNEWLIPPVF